MKKLKFFLSFFCAFCVCSTLFAQDSAVAVVGGAPVFPSWVYTTLIPILVGVYELLIRYIPTVKNYSILGLVIKIIQTLIPNNNASVPAEPHA